MNAGQTRPRPYSLGRAALSGAAWLSGVTLLNGLIGAAVNIVLVRRLGPTPIGMYALAIAVSDLAALLVTWGIDAYLVQSSRPEGDEFGTALSLSNLLALAFLALSVAISAVFYWRDQGMVALLLLGLAVQRWFLLNGSCYGALLQRRFAFGWLALIQISAGVIEHIVAIALALLGAGVWSLLARDMLDAIITLVGARLVSRRPFRLAWMPTTVRAMRQFGSAILLSQCGELANNHLDGALVGLFWGTREIAFYEQAFKLADIPHRVSLPGLNQVALPAYAHLRSNQERASRTFATITRIGLHAVIPVSLAFLLLPVPLIDVAFGTRWLGAVPMLRAFAGYALLSPVVEHLRQFLLAQGDARAVARAKVAQFLIFLPMLGLLLPHWGGEGAAIAVVAGLSAATIVAGLAGRRYLRSVGKPLDAYAPIVFASLVTIAVALGPARGVPDLFRIALFVASYTAVEFLCLRRYALNLRSRVAGWLAGV